MESSKELNLENLVGRFLQLPIFQRFFFFFVVAGFQEQLAHINVLNYTNFVNFLNNHVSYPFILEKHDSSA